MSHFTFNVDLIFFKNVFMGDTQTLNMIIFIVVTVNSCSHSVLLSVLV